MKISQKKQELIIQEYNEFFEKQYGNKTKAERKKLGAFFTPPNLTIKMLERFNDTKGTIIDPCGGSGNLLAGAILVGFDPLNVYYNELDKEIFEIGKARLMGLGVPENNFNNEDALTEKAYMFGEEKGRFRFGI